VVKFCTFILTIDSSRFVVRKASPQIGTRDMPIWGDAFRTTNRDESMVKMKVQNLTTYIESFQQK